MSESDADTTASPQEEAIHVPGSLPVLALKDVVIFPYVIVPLSVGRAKSVRAVDQALASDRMLLLLTQKDSSVDDPGAEDLNEVGCVASIMRMLKLPDGNIRILVQGLARARVLELSQTEPHLVARLERLEELDSDFDDMNDQALMRAVKEGLEQVSSLGKQISPEVMLVAANLNDPLRLADLAASNLGLKTEDSQKVLETLGASERLRMVHELLSREITLGEMQQKISNSARSEMDRSQRDYYLRQQLKAIRRELGDVDDLDEEIEEYRERLSKLSMPEEPRAEVDKQLKRLTGMHAESAESSVLRTWLDWMTTLPWGVFSVDNLDLDAVRAVLDADHHGLDEVKDRIIEHLAVRKLNPEPKKAPILCLVGPPGVGKTSLGRSIARALDRQFIRISLGGVRDEAEIRGHRRTYVGAMPGRVIQGLHQAKTANPVFVLDEIDKIGADFRGDPSSALLEVLDPEQNHTFRDHYLGVEMDLSKVMFLTTANLTETIQPAFLDRMELIRLSGYTLEQKVAIALKHLIPKQIEENGLEVDALVFSRQAIELLIEGYTREAGLRNLERRIGSVCRKIAVVAAKNKPVPRRITPKQVEKLLGHRRFEPETHLKQPRVGVATGLAWTAVGGDVLFIEALAMPGKGGLKLTGSLGEVMKESAQAAMSYAQAHAKDLGIDSAFFDEQTLHVHVPEGATPKDGPSAGVTMLSTIVSTVSGRPIRHDMAMTGEITLRGDVLPVGGIKEKMLAALRAGITEVILPKQNERDLDDLPASAKRDITFHLVERAEQVLELALKEKPAQ